MRTSKVKVNQAKDVKLLKEILYLHHHNSFKGQDIVFFKPANHKTRQHHVRVENRCMLSHWSQGHAFIDPKAFSENGYGTSGYSEQRYTLLQETREFL